MAEGFEGDGSDTFRPLPEPFDFDSEADRTIEKISKYIFKLVVAKGERVAVLPQYIAKAADARRDLEVLKSQVSFLQGCIRSAEMVLSKLQR